MRRRRFLATSATVTTGILAGCSIPGGGGEDGGDEGEGGEDGGNEGEGGDEEEGGEDEGDEGEGGEEGGGEEEGDENDLDKPK